MSVALVTGASSGFGEMTSYALADAGHVVYASMRRLSPDKVEKARAYCDEHRVDLRPIPLDVQDEASVTAAVARVIAEVGRIDILVHNAGHMSFGPAEAFTPEQLVRLYDINVVGAHRLNRDALPIMRRNRRGGEGEALVVWMGSTSPRVGTPPYIGPYFAAKAAMGIVRLTGARATWSGSALRSGPVSGSSGQPNVGNQGGGWRRGRRR